MELLHVFLFLTTIIFMIFLIQGVCVCVRVGGGECGAPINDFIGLIHLNFIYYKLFDLFINY